MSERFPEPVHPETVAEAARLLRTRADLGRRAGFDVQFSQLPRSIQAVLYGIAGQLEYIADFIEGEPSHPPEEEPLGSTLYLDSPTQTHGVKVTATQRDGWLTVTVEADDSIVGYAVRVNGRDL